MLTIADVFTDYLYLLTVPFFYDGIFYALLTSLIATHLTNFVLSVVMTFAVHEDLCFMRFINFTGALIAVNTGNLEIYTIAKNIKKENSYSEYFKYVNGFLLAAFENLPQFLLQMLNTMLIG